LVGVHPVPPWVVHVALPGPGEHHLEFWGPVSARTDGRLDAGYIVLTDHRFLFLRSTGPARSDLTEGFELTLPEIRRVTASAHGVEVRLRVNQHEFRFIVPGDESATDLAHQMLSVVVETRHQRIADLRHSPTAAPHAREPHAAGTGDRACRYCGTIFPTSTVRCPSCGAPRKR
jgi:hypothetical protein